MEDLTATQTRAAIKAGEDSELLAAPELESLVAAKKVLISGYALHVAVEEHAQTETRLGKTTLRQAVDSTWSTVETERELFMITFQQRG